MQRVRVEAAEDTIVSREALLKAVEDLVAGGACLTTMVCLDRAPGFEIIYVFQKPTLELTRLRLEVNRDDRVPSISPVLLAAALIENEIQEFFGVRFTNLALDFQCRMLLAADSPQTPLLKVRADSALQGGEK